MNIPIKKQYDQMLDNPIMPMPDPRHMRCVEWGGKRYPSLEDVLDAINTLLMCAPETNGEVCYQASITKSIMSASRLSTLLNRTGTSP